MLLVADLALIGPLRRGDVRQPTVGTARSESTTSTRSGGTFRRMREAVTTFADAVEGVLAECRQAPPGRRLIDYFGEKHGGPFAGAHFDSYRPTAPNAIEPADLIALTFLSIGVSLRTRSGLTPHAVLRTDELSTSIHPLLQRLPSDATLEELDVETFEGLLGAGSPAVQLYALLRNDVGLPRVATYKLLSRKRPALFPIRDTVVEHALDHVHSDPWWRPWWHTLTTRPQVTEMIEKLRATATPFADDLTTLRVADIAIWMLRRPG